MKKILLFLAGIQFMYSNKSEESKIQNNAEISQNCSSVSQSNSSRETSPHLLQKQKEYYIAKIRFLKIPKKKIR